MKKIKKLLQSLKSFINSKIPTLRVWEFIIIIMLVTIFVAIFSIFFTLLNYYICM